MVAEWFWGRWFATGIGWSGLMVAVFGMFMIGWVPALAIYGVLHALIVLPLAGKSMAARYDLQEGWRQRYKMDDFGVARLRKTITRSAASLPSLILWALGPKEPGQGMRVALAGALGAGRGRFRRSGPPADLGLGGGRGVGGGRAVGGHLLASVAAPVIASGSVSSAALPVFIPWDPTWRSASCWRPRFRSRCRRSGSSAPALSAAQARGLDMTV